MTDQSKSQDVDFPFGLEQAGAVAEHLLKFDTPQSLFLSYVAHNPGVRIKEGKSLFKIMSAVSEVGHYILPQKVIGLIQGRDVLDFGCGTTLYGAAFRALGARSYVGIDPVIDISRRKFRSRKQKSTVNVGISIENILSRIPNIEYYNSSDILENRKFDTIILHTVTEYLQDIDALFALFENALRPGGSIWFLHSNFYSWSGHHQNPRNIKEFDPQNEEHVRYVDWSHVTFEAPDDHVFKTQFNRIRLGDLRNLTQQHFSIVEWTPIEEPRVIQGRLTPEIEQRHSDFSRVDLLTKQVVCLAQKPTL